MAKASGVHVGQTDLPADVAAVDCRVQMPWSASRPTHHSRWTRRVAGPARYVAVGPIFRTMTKETGYEPRGLDLVRYAARFGKPVIAIGGISLANARSVLEAGASAVAVISDLVSDAPTRGARSRVPDRDSGPAVQCIMPRFSSQAFRPNSRTHEYDCRAACGSGRAMRPPAAGG